MSPSARSAGDGADPSAGGAIAEAGEHVAAGPLPGRGIRRASWIGTGVFTVTAVASAIAPNTFIAAGVATSLVLFFAGMALFLWAYAVAVNRSRTDLIGMGGLFFLAGSAPRPVQWSLLGSLAVEVVVGLVTAAVHPFTPLAFGVLAWMYGLALCGLWAARYGTFPPRPPEEKGRRGRAKPKPEPEPTGPKPTKRTTPKATGSAKSGSSSAKSSTKPAGKSSGTAPAKSSGKSRRDRSTRTS